MKDLSDSVEVYKSKPNPFITYTIYVISSLVAVFLVWASLFKIEEVDKYQGILRLENKSDLKSTYNVNKIKNAEKEGKLKKKSNRKKESDFYAEIYVDNAKIGKVFKNQKVKLDILSFPSREYGYFKGKVKNISKDITIDKNTGKAYYIVEVKLQKRKLKDKSGKELKLRNGMACTAKLIKGEKTVLKFIVEKLF